VPYTWLGFSTATTPFVRGKRPRQLKTDIEGRLGAGPQLLDLYFDAGRDVAYVLIKDLGGSLDTKSLSILLGGTEHKKLIDAEQAEKHYPNGLGVPPNGPEAA
jgi:hypothetical protein